MALSEEKRSSKTTNHDAIVMVMHYLHAGGGTRKNFDRDARVTFLPILGLKFENLLSFWVAQNEGYFWGVENIRIIFFG